jgi:hypothetical protein
LVPTNLVVSEKKIKTDNIPHDHQTNKTDRHNITEILLKVAALNIITLTHVVCVTRNDRTRTLHSHLQTKIFQAKIF